MGLGPGGFPVSQHHERVSPGTFLIVQVQFNYSGWFHRAVSLHYIVGVSLFFSLPLMASSKSFMDLCPAADLFLE